MNNEDLDRIGLNDEEKNIYWDFERKKEVEKKINVLKALFFLE